MKSVHKIQFYINHVSHLKECFNKHGFNFDDAGKIGYSRPS